MVRSCIARVEFDRSPEFPISSLEVPVEAIQTECERLGRRWTQWSTLCPETWSG